LKNVARFSYFLRAFPLLFLLTFSLASRPARAADESLGTIEVSDLLLEPTYTYREAKKGAFSPGPSFVGVTWTRDRMISATFKFGSKDLIGIPARYGPASTTDQMGLIEAFGQADSDIGRLRFGLIPSPYGLEGGDAERRLSFPRSLIFQARYLPIRDYGASYRISYEGFFSDWAIHNGEGGPDLDTESWFTARLGWQGGRFLRLGATGVAGRTNPKSTDPLGVSKSADAGIDVDKAARVRVVNFFLEWHLKPVILTAESFAGESAQDDNVIKARAAHLDLEVEVGSSASVLARYDIIDPRNDLGGDQITEYTGGLSFRSAYNNSVFYILGTKKVQQDVKADEHRGLVVWRLTPTATTVPGQL
jgi:hypothetical protein